jgi:hypothetical protein
MNKTLLLALSLTAAAFSAQAQAPATKAAQTAGPAITFEEVKYDFGSVVQGGTVDHTFKFKNTGTAPLVISNIGVSCGCTTPEWTKDPVAPGKTGTISAHFNSTGKMGMQNKVLTIESNATGGSTTVSLVGEVKEAGATAAAAAPAVISDAAPVKAEGKKVKEKADGAKIKAKTK